MVTKVAARAPLAVILRGAFRDEGSPCCHGPRAAIARLFCPSL
jgi:hypothetical protein